MVIMKQGLAVRQRRFPFFSPTKRVRLAVFPYDISL
jgi:hypothetical protein